MSAFNDSETKSFFEDKAGIVQAALCMATVGWDRYDEIHQSVALNGAYETRDWLKSVAYIGQVIESDLTKSDPLIDTGTQCWEALGCDDFDHDYQDLVLDFFLNEGAEMAQGIAHYPDDMSVLWVAAEAFRESLLERVQKYVDEFKES